MNSFNELNGIPATKRLSKEVLKRDWNFDGFVVSGVLSEMMAYGQNNKLLLK
jgi:beta-glucosidase